MTLLETIKSDSLKARKERNTVLSNLLTTLYSEASMVGKTKENRESTEEEVIAVVKKFIKNGNELLHVRPDDVDTIFEITTLESYLPKQLTEEELKGIITTYRANHFKMLNESVPMGRIMAFLKENFAGRYDAKMASQLAKVG